MGPVHQLARVEPPSKISKLKSTPASSTTPSSTHPLPQSQPGAGAVLDVGADLGGYGVPVRDSRPEHDGDGHVLDYLDDGGHPRMRGRPPTPGRPVLTPRPPAPKPRRPAPSSSPSVKHQDGDKLSTMDKSKLSSLQAKAPDAKRFRSPMASIPVSSTGIKIILSPKLATPRTDTPMSSSPGHISPSQGTSRRSRKRKLRSKIWKHFEPVYQGLKVIEAKCIHCHKIFQANRDLGTSSCLRHLETCEGRIRLDDMVAKLKGDNVSSNDDLLKNWKCDQEESENELVKLIVVHELPFSLVEYSKFRSFVSTLNPWFKHLLRTTIKKYCPGAYEEAMATLRNGIESQNCRFSLTADLWTSNQNIGYLCVTCHFIDVNWEIHKRIIKFTPVETPHNGVNLFNAMLRALQDWNLEARVFAVTLDNATANDSFVGSLKDNLFAKSLLLHEGELLHYRCAAHVLNLIAQEGLLAMKGAIDNIRESVKYTRSSPARGERFEKIVHRL